MKIWQLDKTEGKKYKFVIKSEDKCEIYPEIEKAIFTFNSFGDLHDNEGYEITDCFRLGKLLELEFEEVKEIKPGRSENGENYFFISDDAICVTEETNCEIDDKRFNNGNYFTDFKTASKEYQTIRLYQKMKKFSVENGWKDEMLRDSNLKKYFIYLIFEDKKLDITFINSYPAVFEMFFVSKEIAEKAIELFGKEIKKVYGIED